MSLRERFRRWRLQRRRKRAARKQEAAPLREFVYLDEVSVFSLISSRLGPVATEFTATESSSLTGELTGTAGVSASVLKSELKSRSEATQTQGTQVLRKATVQATFKELYEYVEGGFLLRPTMKQPPDVRNARDLETALEYSRAGGWATPASDLTRGQLSEIEVELEAEDIFRVGAIVDIYLELFQEAPELLGPDVREQARQALSMNAVLNKLLAGLVPVRGRAIDYLTVRAADSEWVVHRMVLQQLPAVWVAQAHALDVVAVAEASLFWKDIRRVLFSGSRYSLLCRIGRDGLNDDWTPVKLVDVIRGFAPELAEQLGAAGPDLAAGMSRGMAAVPQGDDNQIKMRKALQAYGQALAAKYNKEWDPGLISGDVFPVDRTCNWSTVEEQRPPFKALTHRLQETFGIHPDRELMATLRYQALVQAGLVPLAGSVASQENATPITQPTGPQSRILDTELIAIYW
jgi:hypothetical protein